ncbi:hypothetical protein [Winogradskyella jejuensis]|uniref:Lipoprotein n=1 Tax=Winogradskyella jejuensis TaxID=1089305 RepID=A0A1M5JQG1_9FLAO|nr:hypothetical protein [Winogradskyella jejuensis]SHG42520.1 hypothetical protein SAMN05444148_0107 [Winogradskyella jejuensis]
MILKKAIVPIILCLVVVLQSCKGDIKVDSIFENEAPKNNIIGKKHFLEEDGIQLQLPEEFERYSAAKYERLLDSLVSKKEFELERERLRNMRNLEGNNYIYFAPDINITYMINTIPYAPIRKQDAQKLLGIIRQNQNIASKNSNVEYTKITAKYRSLTGAQIFKAIFKVDEKKGDRFFYQQAYFISSNQKSVLINISSPVDVDFDPYIEKMIF